MRHQFHFVYHTIRSSFEHQLISFNTITTETKWFRKGQYNVCSTFLVILKRTAADFVSH